MAAEVEAIAPLVAGRATAKGDSGWLSKTAERSEAENGAVNGHRTRAISQEAQVRGSIALGLDQQALCHSRLPGECEVLFRQGLECEEERPGRILDGAPAGGGRGRQ
jgi:hypothetical protein